MKKMRLLTFMQLAETNPEMSFDTIQEELQIDESEVESFIIDGKLFLVQNFICNKLMTINILCKQHSFHYCLFKWLLIFNRIY